MNLTRAIFDLYRDILFVIENFDIELKLLSVLHFYILGLIGKLRFVTSLKKDEYII
jgi:hypothetical protein